MDESGSLSFVRYIASNRLHVFATVLRLYFKGMIFDIGLYVKKKINDAIGFSIQFLQAFEKYRIRNFVN